MYFVRLKEKLRRKPKGLSQAQVIPEKEGGILLADTRPLRHGAMLLAQELVRERPVAIVTQSDALAWGQFRPVRYRMSWTILTELGGLLGFLWSLVEEKDAFLVVAQRELLFQRGREVSFWRCFSVGLYQRELQSVASKHRISVKNLKVEV